MRDGTATDNAPRSIKLLASRGLIEDEQAGKGGDCTRRGSAVPFICHARFTAATRPIDRVRNWKKLIKVERLDCVELRERRSIKIQERRAIRGTKVHQLERLQRRRSSCSVSGVPAHAMRAINGIFATGNVSSPS